MKFRLRGFNLYLWAALLAVSVCAGCKMFGDATELSSVRLFIESLQGNSGGNMVLVTRNKIPYYVNPEPFLTEGDLTKATLIDNADGTFAIRLDFNDHGKLLLDMTTTSSRGRSIVVFSQWPQKGWKEPKNQKEADAQHAADADPDKPRSKGWISAVLIREGMTEGSITFTPDASHLEAERIVRGLNNSVQQINKD